jgi:hypothetical protein
MLHRLNKHPNTLDVTRNVNTLGLAWTQNDLERRILVFHVRICKLQSSEKPKLHSARNSNSQNINVSVAPASLANSMDSAPLDGTPM